MSEFNSFKCPMCVEGQVKMLSPKGLSRNFMKGVTRDIPENILVPRCDKCNETFLGPVVVYLKTI